MPKKDVSRYNEAWGICGFTSALTHLYESDERLKDKIDRSDEYTIRRGLLTEVVTFLKYVTAFNSDLIEVLDELNKALGSKLMGDGVAKFIPLAEKAVRDQVEIEQDNNDYQCALTPEALTLYLQQMCGYTKATLTKGDPGGRCILGLYKDGDLKHWVYRDADGTIYNWGSVIKPEEWETHEDGLRGRRVGCYISFA